MVRNQLIPTALTALLSALLLICSAQAMEATTAKPLKSQHFSEQYFSDTPQTRVIDQRVIGQHDDQRIDTSESTSAFIVMANAGEVATTLDERARRFWEARTSGDLATMYEYETEKLTGRLSLSQYVRRKGRIIYKSAKVLGSEIIGKDKAVVSVVIEAVIPGLSGAIKSNVKDEWVYVDGLWYHGTMSKKAEN